MKNKKLINLTRNVFLFSLVMIGLILIIRDFSNNKNDFFYEKLKITIHQNGQIPIDEPTSTATSNTIKSPKEFYENLARDLKVMKKEKDPRLFKVRTISWNIRDPELVISQNQLNQIINNQVLETEKNSTLELEVEIFSQKEQTKKTVITQFSYTDQLSKNKVHEFSRMFQIEGKKKPD